MFRMVGSDNISRGWTAHAVKGRKNDVHLDELFLRSGFQQLFDPAYPTVFQADFDTVRMGWGFC